MLIASLAITNCMFVVVFSIIYVYNHNCHVGEWVWLERGLLGLFLCMDYCDLFDLWVYGFVLAAGAPESKVICPRGC